jgi:hypothetical protein
MIFGVEGVEAQKRDINKVRQEKEGKEGKMGVIRASFPKEPSMYTYEGRSSGCVAEHWCFFRTNLNDDGTAGFNVFEKRGFGHGRRAG